MTKWTTNYCENCEVLARENEKLRTEANPWRYPAKGELPSDLVFKEITRAADDVIDLAMFQNNRWWMRDGGKVGVRAWRELPAPAPLIEKGESK